MPVGLKNSCGAVVVVEFDKKAKDSQEQRIVKIVRQGGAPAMVAMSIQLTPHHAVAVHPKPPFGTNLGAPLES